MKKILMIVIVILASVPAMYSADKNPLILLEGNYDFIKDASAKAILEIETGDAKVVEFDENYKVEKEIGSMAQYLEQENDQNYLLYKSSKAQIESVVAEHENELTDEQKEQIHSSLENARRTCYNHKYLSSNPQGFKKNKKGLKFISMEKNAYMTPQQIKTLEKSGQIVGDRSDAKYLLTIQADTLDLGTSAGADAVAAGRIIGGVIGNTIAVACSKAGGVILSGTAIVKDQQSGTEVAKIRICHLKGDAGSNHTMRLESFCDEFLIKCMSLANQKK